MTGVLSSPSNFRKTSLLAKKLHENQKEPEVEQQEEKVATPVADDKDQSNAMEKSTRNEGDGNSAKFISNRVRRTWDNDGGPMDGIRELHNNIQDTIEKMQGRTIQVLKNQEQDLLRAFKSTMAGVQQELAKEKKKNATGSVEWVEKCHKLTSELEWLRDTAKKLGDENKQMSKELRRYKRILKQKDDDREFLIKQLVAAKKTNHEFSQRFGSPTLSPGGGVLPSPTSPTSSTQAFPRLTRPYSSSKSGGMARGGTDSRIDDAQSHPTSASRRSGGGAAAMSGTQEKRYRNIIAKLKRQLEAESHKIKKLKAANHTELSTRNELQAILKQCILDARGSTQDQIAQVSVSRDVRRRTIDNLMSNNKVVYMLYEAIFPRGKAASVTAEKLLDELEAARTGETDTKPFDDWVDTKLMKSRPESSSTPKRGGRKYSGRR